MVERAGGLTVLYTSGSDEYRNSNDFLLNYLHSVQDFAINVDGTYMGNNQVMFCAREINNDFLF